MFICIITRIISKGNKISSHKIIDVSLETQFVGVALSPHETDAPLLVDPDAVLALSVTA